MNASHEDSRRMRATRLALLVAITVPSVAGAQAPADTSSDSARVRLRGVTVTSARAAAVVGGASAVVIRPEELRSSPAPLLEQALRESPFVHVRQNSRGEMELSVRGSDSRQAAVMLDGVPLTLGWDHRTDPSLIPITGTRSITIVRGLGSLLNGPNTLGGTIEVDHGTGVANDVWVGAGVDENGAIVSTLGGERMVTSSLAVRGGFSYRKRDGFALPDDATDPTARDGLRTNSDQTHVDGFASAHWSGAAGRSLGLTVTGFDAERGVPPEEHIAGPRFWRYPYHSRVVVALSGSTGAFRTPFGTASMDVGGGVNSGAVKIDIYDDRTYANITGNEIGNERNVVGRVRASHSFGPGTLRAAFTSSNIDFRESLSGVVAEYRQNLWSAGAELEMPVMDRTTLAGGVVFDKASTPETGGRTPGQVPVDNIGWRVGASHELTSSLRLHASGSQRSRFPALRELYSGAANRFQPNPDLKPETLLGFEGGLTWNNKVGTNGRAVAEVTGFSHNLEDAVVRVTVPNPTPPPASFFRRVNRDNIVSSGVELLAGYTFGDVRDRAVSITGDAMIQRITIKDQTAADAQRHAENNPERRGSLELGIPLPLALRGIAQARYTGKQYCLNADTGNEDRLDARTEGDLALERGFTLRRSPFQRLRALVSLDNVANATVFDQCGLVQPGRTLRVMFVLR
jgi:iron complex outermembrane receptor protein